MLCGSVACFYAGGATPVLACIAECKAHAVGVLPKQWSPC